LAIGRYAFAVSSLRAEIRSPSAKNASSCLPSASPRTQSARGAEQPHLRAAYPERLETKCTAGGGTATLEQFNEDFRTCHKCQDPRIQLLSFADEMFNVFLSRSGGSVFIAAGKYSPVQISETDTEPQQLCCLLLSENRSHGIVRLPSA